MTVEEGAALVAGNSGLLDGPLGNCLIGFDGYMLGKTTEDTSIKSDDDVKDILYSQEGTKAADHVVTGQLGMISATFAEIKTSLLNKMKFGFSSLATPGVGNDSGTLGRYIYKSLRENKAKAIRVYATDANGIPSLEEHDVFNGYLAVPIVQDSLINWGADTQRNLKVEFMLYYKVFGTEQVTGGPVGAFGYYGDPTQEKVPATNWPDVASPILLSAEATSSTSMTLTFNENIAKQAGAPAAGIVADVDGSNVVATTLGAVSGVTIPITFPAATFASGDVIKVTIENNVIEDTETPANEYAGIADSPVTNSVP